jgi:hypothetical protein
LVCSTINDSAGVVSGVGSEKCALDLRERSAGMQAPRLHRIFKYYASPASKNEILRILARADRGKWLKLAGNSEISSRSGPTPAKSWETASAR